MRLIDADALINTLGVSDEDIDFREIIGDAPTIDAEPVKHGEWELDPNGMDWNIPAWRCSGCGFVANYIGVEVNGLGNNPMNWAGSNFCPNCGAKMDKDCEERREP